MNSINIISPYKYNGQWVFDDSTRGLEREAFVAGSDSIIDIVTAGIVHAEDGFILIFSEDKFPGYQFVLEWEKAEHNGNWYHNSTLGMRGWLCPALMKYFDVVPKKIYFQVKAR